MGVQGLPFKDSWGFRGFLWRGPRLLVFVCVCVRVRAPANYLHPRPFSPSTLIPEPLPALSLPRRYKSMCQEQEEEAGSASHRNSPEPRLLASKGSQVRPHGWAEKASRQKSAPIPSIQTFPPKPFQQDSTPQNLT
jgi:hypothetical protein